MVRVFVTSVMLGRALTNLGTGVQPRTRTERAGRHEVAVRRIASTLLLFVLVDCFNAQGQDDGTGCLQHQYFNATLGYCQTCTDCSSIEQMETTPCSANADTVCGTGQEKTDCTVDLQFYNITSRNCQDCRACAPYEHEVSVCTLEEDTECVQRCSRDYVYQAHLDSCSLDCGRCPEMRCKDQFHCQCTPERCFDSSDALCRFDLCDDASEDPSTGAPSTSSPGNNLEPWGIGLIAVGVVIGIIAFSACFLLMGVCTSSSTRRRRLDVGSEESQSSKSGLVVPGSSVSGATTTTTLGGGPNHTAVPVITCSQNSIEALRQHQQNHYLYHHQIFNSSVIKSSPRGLRTGGNGRKENTVAHV